MGIRRPALFVRPARHPKGGHQLADQLPASLCLSELLRSAPHLAPRVARLSSVVDTIPL